MIEVIGALAIVMLIAGLVLLPFSLWLGKASTKPRSFATLCPKCGNLDAWGDEGKKCCLTCGAHQPPPRDFLY
jgi:hypothetical protein